MMPYSEIVTLEKQKKTRQHETITAQRLLKNTQQQHAKVMEQAKNLSSNDFLLFLTKKNTK